MTNHMTSARSLIIDESTPGCYHLISRCVRRAFLCGEGYEHRKDWLEQRIRCMAEVFAVDVMALAIMSNHFHLVASNRPDLADQWDAEEVAERWATLYPRRDEYGEVMKPDPNVLAAWAADAKWVATHRQRLASISWFMRCIKEPLARIANNEDHCTGAFWEGRFKAVALLDAAAVATCMAYVDLNPIRAKAAKTPEESDHTSIQMRIQARQRHAKQQKLSQQISDPEQLSDSLISQGLHQANHPEEGIWLAGISECKPPQLHNPLFTLDEYCQLVDETGRCLAAGKRGAISPHLLPILERLELDVNAWFKALSTAGRFLGTAVGSLATRAQEALRRGVNWIADKAGFYPTAAKHSG